MYYNARYTEPALGTFISPDTMMPDPEKVINFNRFAYARNNPCDSATPQAILKRMTSSRGLEIGGRR